MYSQNFQNKSNKFGVTDIEFKVIVKKNGKGSRVRLESKCCTLWDPLIKGENNKI